MIESLDSFQKLKPSKSMSQLTPSFIDTKIINQIGNYTLGMELGSGAFGKVVLGKHILTGETVAIKILDKIMLKKTPEDYELVKKEMSILKLVKHKYIIQLYEILQTPNYIFIIMEYCEGKDFMDYILSKNYLPESEALKYFQQLINALFYLHSQNIAHRDIKIDNILLDQNKNLKLIDFGLSTKYQENKLLDQPCGTIVYSAPEVLEGKLYHGMLADVWSCGIVLYGMLCGYLPFSEDDDGINKKNIIKGNFEMPNNISIGAKNLLKHLLDINPMTRYTLQEIKDHPWFKMNNFFLIQGIIIGYHKIPVDEEVLDLCEKFNFDRNKIKYSVINNKFDEGSALYYLLVKQRNKKGIHSISDLFSDKFIKYIYNEDNLIANNNIINCHKIKNENAKNDLNDKIWKTESNLSAAPGLGLGVISTPKKIKKFKLITNENEKNAENDKTEKQRTDINKAFKKNKKIKLYSSINKKSISRIQKSNNIVTAFLEDNNYISNTSNLYLNKKIKNKIAKDKNNQINKVNNYKNIKSKIKYNYKFEENHSPFNQTKYVMDNIHKAIKKSKNKLMKDLNQQLSTKEIIVNKNSEKCYVITSNSQMTKKSINKIEQNIKKNFSIMNKISSLKLKSNISNNKKNRSNYIKTNCKSILRNNKDYSTIHMEKKSKSIDNIEYNLKKQHKNKSNEKLNFTHLEVNKHKNKLSKKGFKNNTPINKILKHNINYLSNFISTTNSKEKRNIINLKKPQIRNDRNEEYSTNYTYYTKSSSYSSNAIKKCKNKKRISTNVFNLCRNTNIKIFDNSIKPNNSNINNEKICHFIINKFNKNKINKSLNIFFNNGDTSNKKKCNNLKLIKINKLEKLKKSSKYLYINSKIFKGLKQGNQQKNINHSKYLNDKHEIDNTLSSIIPPLKKYKYKINLSTSHEKNLNAKEIGIKNYENISLIKVNQKSKSRGKNLTSPNKYKLKQKIKYNYDINKNENKLNRKRYFESTVITRRYKSPAVFSQLSESQNKKYLSKKNKNKQLNLKSVKKGMTDKKIINDINKNSFISKNNIIKNKVKTKRYKNKTPLKIITNINLNNNKNSFSKDYKLNIKNTNNNFINNKTQINNIYSKENIYYAPNLLYKINSPKNQNMKNKHQEIHKNNHSINLLDSKSYSIIQAINNKCNNNYNKKVYHRNLNHFNISNINNTNLTNNNYCSNNSISTSLSMNSFVIVKDKIKINNIIMNPFILDLSCIFFDKKNINECCSFLVNKLDKNGYNYKQINYNIFELYNSENLCQIEILQIVPGNNSYNIKNKMNCDEKDNNPIFYFKMSKKKGSTDFIKSFSKILFSDN